MKLNLNQSVAALDGTEIPQSNLADLLASSLCGKTPGIESVKAMDWALSLKNNKIKRDELSSNLFDSYQKGGAEKMAQWIFSQKTKG